jgi:hypothetical protein
MDKFKELKGIDLFSWKRDTSSIFDKGNKAAGTRLRLSLYNLKSLAQDIRNEE